MQADACIPCRIPALHSDELLTHSEAIPEELEHSKARQAADAKSIAAASLARSSHMHKGCDS